MYEHAAATSRGGGGSAVHALMSPVQPAFAVPSFACQCAPLPPSCACILPQSLAAWLSPLQAGLRATPGERSGCERVVRAGYAPQPFGCELQLLRHLLVREALHHMQVGVAVLRVAAPLAIVLVLEPVVLRAAAATRLLTERVAIRQLSVHLAMAVAGRVARRTAAARLVATSSTLGVAVAIVGLRLIARIVAVDAGARHAACVRRAAAVGEAATAIAQREAQRRDGEHRDRKVVHCLVRLVWFIWGLSGNVECDLRFQRCAPPRPRRRSPLPRRPRRTRP